MGRTTRFPECYFSDNERHFLAGVVQDYPCLWNELDSLYRDPYTRAKAWKVIAEEFVQTFGHEVTPQQVQKQFKNLRDVFMKKFREIRSLVNSGEDVNGSVASKIRLWPFYSELEYLGTNYQISDMEQNGTMIGDDLLLDIESDQQPDQKNQVEKLADDNNFVPSTPSSEVGGSLTQPRCPVKRRAVRERDSSSSDGERIVYEEARNVVRETPSQPQQDSFDALGSHLASRLRKLNVLDPLKCEEFRLKIDMLHVDISRAILDLQTKTGTW